MTEMVHSIHTSERLSYRGCRRRWSWIFQEGYYPKITPKYFEFGTAYHLAMEILYEPSTWYLWELGGITRNALQNLVIKAFCDKVRQQRNTFLINSGQESLSMEEETDYEERLELGKGMLKYYFDLMEGLDDGFKPLQTEVSFDVPIVNPDTGEPLMCYNINCYKHKGVAPVPVTYGGRCDLLVLDKYGHLYILDWKTAARVDHEALLFLELDDQIGSYPWALRSLGIDVKGFIYHQQKKGYPQPPTENKTIRLGRRFSVSKTQDTDYDTYANTVMKEDREAYDAGYYDEFLDFLRVEGVKFYNRVQVSKTPYELDQVGRNIFLEAQEMMNPNLVIYPSTGKMGCSSCAFREPCVGKNAGHDYIYTLGSMFDKLTPYWERNREPDSDKRYR